MEGLHKLRQRSYSIPKDFCRAEHVGATVRFPVGSKLLNTSNNAA